MYGPKKTYRRVYIPTPRGCLISFYARYPDSPTAASSATAANQVIEIAVLNSIDTKLTSPITVTGTVTATNPSVGIEGAAAPASATEVAGVDSLGDLRALSVSTTGVLDVQGPLTDAQLRATPVPVSGTVTATNPSVGLTGSPAPASATEVAGVDGTGDLVAISVDSNGVVDVNVTASTLPTGAATSANQTTEIAAINSFADKTGAGFVPEAFDETAITYVGATTRINTVTYKLATATVAVLTMSYDGSDRLSGVVKT